MRILPTPYSILQRLSYRLIAESLFAASYRSKKGKRSCLLYGNCQIYPLSVLLACNTEFRKTYKIIRLKPVFALEASDLKDLERVCKEVDLFIYQPVREGYRGYLEFGTNYLKSLLKPEAVAISFPSLYFKGYNPEMVYLRESNSRDLLISPFGGYHNRNIFDMFLKGYNKRDIVNFLSERQAISKSYISKEIETTFNELKSREEKFSVDIRISNYIEKNWKKKRLFWTFNHPSNELLIYIADSILQRVCIDSCKYKVNFLSLRLLSTELLGRVYFSIHPGIHSHFNLKFLNPSLYSAEGNKISHENVVKIYFDLYMSNDVNSKSYLATNT